VVTQSPTPTRVHYRAHGTDTRRQTDRLDRRKTVIELTIGVDLTGILGERMAELTIKVLL